MRNRQAWPPICGWWVVAAALLLSVVSPVGDAAAGAPFNTTVVVIDPAVSGLRFDGHGGLSAGGSSRLLIDYAEPYRSQILDYLYLPKFGASLQVCKVEIGGDTQATDGTEPSHMHSRHDLNCSRGYEFWLMKEALKRNPRMVTYGLIWGAPGWINNQTGFYGPDLQEYQLSWLRCAQDTHGISVDWLGLWNERPDNFDYMKSLKKALHAEGMTTQLVIGDNRRFNAPAVMQQHGNDPEFLAAFGAVGIHYPCGRTCGQAMTDAGKACWASEDLWTQPSWGGSVCWATEFNKNFILSNMTSTLSWATLWSAYPNVDVFAGSGDPTSGDDFWGPGLLYAWQPWSGHYALPPTVWASAHTTQFSEVGWKMPFSGAGSMASGGSHLTMISPNRSDFSIVIETASAACHRCRGFSWPAEVAQMLTIEVPTEMVAVATQLTVWASNETHQFFQLPSLRPAAAAEAAGRRRHGATTTFSLLVQPQSLYTISTTTGQQKGAHPLPPPSGAFPAEWSDDFDSTADETLGKYFADQCGSFQVMPLAPGGRGKALRQRVSQQPGVNSWNGNLLNPLTLIGDANAATNVYDQTTLGVRLRLPMPPPSSPDDPTADAAAVAPPQLPPFIAHANNRLFGRGYWQITGNFTLAEAEAKCLVEPQCKAMTMESPTLPSPTESIVMWLTADVNFFAAHGWQTYVLNGTHPPPPPPPVPLPPLHGSWGGLCGRVMAVGENNGKQAGVQSGVCLQLNASSVSGGASYRLLEDGMTVLASGHLPGCRAIDTWLSVQLRFVGQNVSVLVNNQQLATATVKATGGMAGLGCGWHIAEFDDFAISRSNRSSSTAGVLLPPAAAAARLKIDDRCATANLAGTWLRMNESNATIEYTLSLMPGSNTSYTVTSPAALGGSSTNNTIVQGPDFVQFVQPGAAVAPDSSTELGDSAAMSTYGRVLGGVQCNVLRWIRSKLSSADAAAVAPPPPPPFVAHANNRLFGRGYWQITGNFTLAEAEAKCLVEPQCKAMTMESPTLPSPTESIVMWLTADVNFFAAHGWQTFVVNDHSDHPTNSGWHRKDTLPPLRQAPALPTKQQLEYQARELTQFMHFSVSTMAPINCSNGTRCVVKEQNCLDANNEGSSMGDHVWNASLFNPELLDTDQWVSTAVEWGAQEICLTAKHTGGFTLWPTNALNGTYNYSVKYSPWKDGKGDVIREFTNSCRKYNVKPCFYFIADWNCVDEKTLDVPTYTNMIWTMVHELLTDYGAISRLWFDVFPSGPSIWNAGGFPEEYHELVSYVQQLSPETLVLSGSDGCMAGHEKGYSGYPLYHGQGVPNSVAGEMCDNNMQGLWYRPEEVDYSIQNPGDAWFWHPNVEYLSAVELWNTYMLTVARGASLILNVPPNSSGL
jgi:alpha-L-fucosidase